MAHALSSDDDDSSLLAGLAACTSLYHQYCAEQPSGEAPNLDAGDTG